VTANKFCIGQSCKSNWQEGGNEYWTKASNNIYSNVRVL